MHWWKKLAQKRSTPAYPHSQILPRKMSKQSDDPDECERSWENVQAESGSTKDEPLKKKNTKDNLGEYVDFEEIEDN